MSATTDKAPWRCERLGLIATVEFSRGDSRLTWCDGQWRMGTARVQMSAPGVPTARTMNEAVKVGKAFLAACEDEVCSSTSR